MRLGAFIRIGTTDFGGCLVHHVGVLLRHAVEPVHGFVDLIIPTDCSPWHWSQVICDIRLVDLKYHRGSPYRQWWPAPERRFSLHHVRPNLRDDSLMSWWMTRAVRRTALGQLAPEPPRQRPPLACARLHRGIHDQDVWSRQAMLR